MLWSSTLPRESRYDARGGTRGGRRLPLREAAEVLGVSKDAVRQRVKRGTIRSDKGEDGRVYVYVDASSEATTDGVHSTGGAADELLERTEELITTLREQLQAERQAHAEARRLLAAALERIPPQLPAPEDASESPQPRRDRTAPPTPAESRRRAHGVRGGGAGWKVSRSWSYATRGRSRGMRGPGSRDGSCSRLELSAPRASPQPSPDQGSRSGSAARRRTRSGGSASG
jgi:hypothetical protein